MHKFSEVTQPVNSGKYHVYVKHWFVVKDDLIEEARWGGILCSPIFQIALKMANESGADCVFAEYVFIPEKFGTTKIGG